MDDQHYSNHGAVRREVIPSGHRRAFYHDYREAGTYMVTIVTEGRMRVFGHIEGSAVATRKLDRTVWAHDKDAPHLVLSELGRRVVEEEIPKISRFYPQVEVWRVAMMPDHIHLLLRVREALPEGKHLGQVVSGFKSGCSRAWWRLLDDVAALAQPAGETAGTAASMFPAPSASMFPAPSAPVQGSVAGVGVIDAGLRQAIMAVLGVQRAAVPEGSPSGSPSQQPVSAHLRRFSSNCPQHWASYPLLFSSGYHDRIINRLGMLDNIKRYMLENPLRARIREECPQLMERQLHLWIDGHEYAAFGNLFLLKYPQKEQVFFHRFTEVDATERQAILSSAQLMDKERQHLEKASLKMPTHLTAAYREEFARLLRIAEEGTVLVTPGISKGESLVAEAAVELQLPLILLQKEPISRYWKPGQRRFFACARGWLLILAPWRLDEDIVRQQGTSALHLGDVSQPISDYARFHHLNDLARDICDATEMRILNYSSVRNPVR